MVFFFSSSVFVILPFDGRDETRLKHFVVFNLCHFSYVFINASAAINNALRSPKPKSVNKAEMHVKKRQELTQKQVVNKKKGQACRHSN